VVLALAGCALRVVEKKGNFSMKKLLAALFITTMLVSNAHAQKVCDVLDGDTLKLCSGKTIRLTGVDAPELHQPFGYESREYLKELVMDKEVDLGCRARAMKRDMCNVQVNGLNVQSEMVKQGLAFDFPRYSNGRYATEQAQAKQANVGVWMQSEGSIKNWDLRQK
jgi:endonuclease YncB( thermonuclease family)